MGYDVVGVDILFGMVDEGKNLEFTEKYGKAWLRGMHRLGLLTAQARDHLIAELNVRIRSKSGRRPASF